MAANRHDKLLRLDARLEKLRKERPVVFNLISLAVALLLAGVVLLIEWCLR